MQFDGGFILNLLDCIIIFDKFEFPGHPLKLLFWDLPPEFLCLTTLPGLEAGCLPTYS